ncbi:MAG: hypothetical protein R3E50_08605 [Halioglobus sp.]
MIHPTCFGQGKVDAAQALAATPGQPGQQLLLPDSLDDLLLLERVWQPWP